MPMWKIENFYAHVGVYFSGFLVPLDVRRRTQCAPGPWCPGTGTGELLEHLHRSQHLLLTQLLGLSAVDHRSSTSLLPDSSYRLLNIDRLSQDQELEGQQFHLVLSFHTLYHLVDPLGVLTAVHKLLAPGGLAVLSHVPLQVSYNALFKKYHKKSDFKSICFKSPPQK